MSDSTSTTPAPTAPVTNMPRDNSLQNKAHANAIGSSERLLKSIQGSPELLLALAPSGYNEQRLSIGMKLFATAQTKFAARQEAMAVATAAIATRKKAYDVAKTEFVSYRTAVQVNYKTAERANLGASGRVATDGDKFITNARSAYSTALTSPYLEKLSEFGFTKERLTAALANLETLTNENSTADNATSKAQNATESRDAAVEALNTWVMQLRKIAKDALQKHPDLLSLFKA